MPRVLVKLQLRFAKTHLLQHKVKVGPEVIARISPLHFRNKPVFQIKGVLGILTRLKRVIQDGAQRSRSYVLAPQDKKNDHEAKAQKDGEIAPLIRKEQTALLIVR